MSPFPSGQIAPAQLVPPDASDAIVFVGKGAVFETDINTGNGATLLGSPSDVQVGDWLFCFSLGYSVPVTPTENPGPWVELGTTTIRARLWGRIATADANDNFTVPVNAGDTSSFLFNMRASNGNPYTEENKSVLVNTTEIGWSVNSIAAGAANDTMLIYWGGRNVPNNNGSTGIAPATGSMSDFTVIESIIAVRSGGIQRERLGWVGYKFQSGAGALLAATSMDVTPGHFNGDTRGQTARYKS